METLLASKFFDMPPVGDETVCDNTTFSPSLIMNSAFPFVERSEPDKKMDEINRRMGNQIGYEGDEDYIDMMLKLTEPYVRCPCFE